MNKSISLPFAFVEKVLDESEVTGLDFSGTLLALARVGLAVRREERHREEERLKEEAQKRINKGG